MVAFRVYTIDSGEVKEGAKVEKLTLRGAGITIPAIKVGEEGRGRELGVLPVQLLPKQYAKWEQDGSVEIRAAEIGQTKRGSPKLLARENADSDEKVVCVFRTKIGFRGSNDHSGDLTVKEGDKEQFAPFPGEVLVKGEIAQGAAGRMGAGEQLVAVMPRGVVFRTEYSGRLYGRPWEHYYLWDGSRLLAATWEERTAADLF
jgi:hypothetical protein